MGRTIIFDLEATGPEPSKAKIIQFAFKVVSEGVTHCFNNLVNPGIPIPMEVQELTGITDEMVKDKPLFSHFALKIDAIVQMKDDDFIVGYNAPRFDVPLLYDELAACGIQWNVDLRRVIDPGGIFKRREERTLSAAVKFFLNQDIEGAHTAMGDVEATIAVLNAQIERYQDLPKNWQDLAIYSQYDNIACDVHGKIGRDKDGDYIYLFGKSKGVKIKDDPGFGRWMLGKDFSFNTRQVVEQALEEIEREWSRIQEEEQTAQEEHHHRETQGGLF